MTWTAQYRSIVAIGLLSGVLAAGLPGCTGAAENAALAGGIVVGTAILAQSPANEIEQIYYLGVFDPREQVPPTVYRIRVHGQASAISNTKFASGWVKADLIDSLQSKVGFEAEGGGVEVTGAENGGGAIKTGRRLMVFGPEGFRESPTDHRLVIVMGASPQAFFQAIDDSLGVIAEVQQEQLESALAQDLFQELQRVRAERIRLVDLQADLREEATQ